MWRPVSSVTWHALCPGRQAVGWYYASTPFVSEHNLDWLGSFQCQIVSNGPRRNIDIATTHISSVENYSSYMIFCLQITEIYKTSRTTRNKGYLHFANWLTAPLHPRTSWRCYYHRATACNATHDIARGFCQSVKCVDCDKTKESCGHILIAHERLFILVFLTVNGDDPSTWNFGSSSAVTQSETTLSQKKHLRRF